MHHHINNYVALGKTAQGRLLIALLLVLLLSAISATAKIKYTDVNPDTTITATVSQVFARYDIDLNKDGIIDFYIKHFHPSSTTQQAEFYTQVGESGEVLTDANDVPLALNQNDNISSAQTQWVNKATAMFSTALQMADNWAGKSDKYVGVRIKVNNHWNYGWVRITIPADLSKIIVKDYAVNEVADSSIHAGQVIPTGINEVAAAEKAVSIYPNPFTATATIHCTAGDLYIFNAYGQKVKTMHFTKEDSIELKRDGLTAGIYYYVLKQDNRQVTGKIVIAE